MEKVVVGPSLLKVHFGTALVLWTLSFFVSIWLYVGNPLRCTQNLSNSPSTCTVEGLLVPWNYTAVREQQSYVAEIPNIDNTKTYARHEWIGVILFWQAILFAFPYWLWRQWGQKHAIKLNTKSTLANLLKHTRFAVLILCELFCWINGIVQCTKLDQYFDYAFTRNGSDVFSWASTPAEVRDDPFIRTFPRRLKCFTAPQYGASGALMKTTETCWLAIATFIEKIFMVSWFWFVFLNVITSLVMVYHISMWLMACFGFFQLDSDKKDNKTDDKKYVAMNEMS